MDNEAVKKLFEEAFAVLTALRAQVFGDAPVSADAQSAAEAPPVENFPTTVAALAEWADARGLERPAWKTIAMACGFRAGTKHLSPDEIYIFAKAIDNHLKKVGK